MGRVLGVGIIGCGAISSTYMELSPLFRGIKIRACADINMEAARRLAAKYNIRAEAVDGLLRSDDIDIIVNLTVPAVHYAVSMEILDAGKHVYSEKPLVLTVEEGLDLKKRADAKGLRVGSAPDTFLGGSHQLARYLVDKGKLGRITSGTCHVMSHGMEHWHPNPDFLFQTGGGPILDLGPYYIGSLIQLIGPVKCVAALAKTPAKERIILSKPRRGERIPVNTPTTVLALIEFKNGAAVTFNASWDVWHHGHAPMELYGEEGTLHVPNPNFFGGPVRFSRKGKLINRVAKRALPFVIPNQRRKQGPVANYRSAGLADMALSIIAGRPHRCTLESAVHTVDVMTGILRSGETNAFIDMRTTCERSAALGVREARALLA